MEQFRDCTINPLWKVGNMGTVIRPSGKPSLLSSHSLGYLTCGIKTATGFKLFKVHRLVALAWAPNPHNKPEVNHIDGNKQNNKVENLEWVTHRENHIHGRATGLWANAAKRIGFKHSAQTRERMSAAATNRWSRAKARQGNTQQQKPILSPFKRV